MPKYLRTNATAKAGINYIRSIVESYNCIFQKIDQENDVGIDALIEVVDNEVPTGKFIAAQIKSGKSYYDEQAKLCKFPIGDHRTYWSNYSLPVYGIVYVPELESAFWVDVKEYLKCNPNDSVISYESTLVNEINRDTFIAQFIPHITGEVPSIEYEFAKQLFHSSNPDEMYTGLYTLFKLYSYNNEVWKLFIDYFKSHEVQDIPASLVYYMSVIPWHSDMLFFQDSYTPESREYGKTLIRKLCKDDVLKLLHFVDEENMISRGSLGQSVEAIVSMIPNCKKYLEEVISDKRITIKIREVAAVIYAYQHGLSSIDVLKAIGNDESWYIPELINHLRVYGSYDP